MYKPIVWTIGVLVLSTLSGQATVWAGDEVDITGVFNCRGQNPDGSSYRGTARISKEGDAYSIKWVIANETHIGLAIRQGNTLCACWGKDGLSGLVVYKIGKGPELMGCWVHLNSNGKMGNDTLSAGDKLYDVKLAAGATAIAGDFVCEGENLKGGKYRGIVKIKKEGDIHNLQWTIADKTHQGVGLRFGDTLAAAWKEGNSGGIAVYEIAKGPVLLGRWSELGTKGLVLSEALVSKGSGVVDPADIKEPKKPILPAIPDALPALKPPPEK